MHNIPAHAIGVELVLVLVVVGAYPASAARRTLTGSVGTAWVGEEFIISIVVASRYLKLWHFEYTILEYPAAGTA